MKTLRSVPTTAPADPTDPAPAGLRILVLNYEYPPIGGGASPVTAAVAHELVRQGHRLDVVTMAYGDLPAFEERGALRIHRVKCLRSSPHIGHAYELASWLRPALLRSRELLRADPFDLIHSHFFLPSGIVARKLSRESGVPYVVTAHGSDVKDYNPDRFRAMHHILLPFWRRIAGDAHAITSPSHSLASLIRRHLGGDREIAIIPNGIQADWIDPFDEGPEAKTKSILLVSRLFERKGAQFLLEALRELRTGWQVHIVGDGPYMGPLEKLAADVPDSVIFHGWLDNKDPALKRLYREASIFVFPSLAENFPISLLEAMISSTAIVATGLDSCKEVLGDGMRAIGPRDVTGLREELRELIADPDARAELGQRARQRVLDKFTWDRVGREYHELFSKVAIRRSGDGP